MPRNSELTRLKIRRDAAVMLGASYVRSSGIMPAWIRGSLVQLNRAIRVELGKANVREIRGAIRIPVSGR